MKNVSLFSIFRVRSSYGVNLQQSIDSFTSTAGVRLDIWSSFNVNKITPKIFTTLTAMIIFQCKQNNVSFFRAYTTMWRHESAKTPSTFFWIPSVGRTTNYLETFTCLTKVIPLKNAHVFSFLGMMYNEITASSLVKVNMQGEVVEEGTTNFGVNQVQPW